MAALREGAVDAHQHGLDVGVPFAAVAVAVFADDHRRADGPFGEVVGEGHVVVFEEREQFVARPLQPLDQAAGLAVVSRRGEEFLQTRGNALALGGEQVGRPRVLLSLQPQRVGCQTAQFLGEGRPR
jgi:hypothetical protein